MPTEFRSVAGYYADKTLRTRNIFTTRQREIENYVPSLSILNGTYSRDPGATPTDFIRAGNMVGKITATGLYRTSIIGLTTADYTSGGTSLTVAAAVATEIARLIALAGTSISLKAVGPPTTAGTVAVTAVTCSAASGTTLTVSSLGADKITGTAICPADGSHVPLNVIGKADGLDVVDAVGNAVNQSFNLLRGADFIATQIVNLTEGDASTQAWFKTELKLVGMFTFDNDR